MTHTLKIDKTELVSWPYKITISGGGGTNLRLDIYNWLNNGVRKIKYDYTGPGSWYLRNEDDALAFALRFS